MNIEDAYKFVKEKRRVIGPNIGFIQCLQELEEKMIDKEENRAKHFVGYIYWRRWEWKIMKPMIKPNK